MGGHSFQAKLIYLVVAVLVVLQTVTLAVIHIAGMHSMRQSLSEQLRVGGRVFDRILSTRGKQLSESLRLLAADFGFREAIALNDRATLISVLANHGTRINADAEFLVGLDGIVEADTMKPSLTGRPFPFPGLIAVAEQTGEASSIVSINDRPYQVVLVPVLAPRAIAWVCMGFEINDSVIRDFERLTSLNISLSTIRAGSVTAISSLPDTAQNELSQRLRGTRLGFAPIEETLRLAGADYAGLIQPLRTADRSSIATVIMRPLEEANRTYRSLEIRIVIFSTLALVAALACAMYFTRSFVRPLSRLADNAQRIGRGDYTTPIDTAQDDEIGQLAGALNRMRSGIADRELQIIHQATHDGLTGLPNRTLFLDRLEQAIASARRSGDSVGMIMMDLDRFKEINDTLGHHFGDQLLVEIGRRLTGSLRETDTVARLGGDEFGIRFITHDQDETLDVTRRIAHSLEAPFILGGVAIAVNASIGIALYPRHADDAGTLMKRADIAMYDAKKNHTGTAVYEPGRDDHSVRRLSLLSELRMAIQNDQLELFYQPAINLRTRRVVHAEALVRWIHPVHGRMNPDEFIPLAEQSGAIGALTKWVLGTAIRECARWTQNGYPLTVAVNLSALDLFDAELPDYISGLLAEATVSPMQLVLEITESAIMKDPTYALKILKELKSRGIRLAIDDFGTGYSSLAHLKRLPVDELKIDKSFVLNLTSQSTDDAVIVRSTIELGHNMGLTVVAEGVETNEALDILRRLGCDMAQGYFMSPPISSQGFKSWIVESPWAVLSGGERAATA